LLKVAETGRYLATGRDAQLGEGPVQVAADGAGGQVQPLADLLVGVAVGRHLDDLQFLGGQRLPGGRGPSRGLLAGGAQLGLGLGGPDRRPDAGERGMGRAQARSPPEAPSERTPPVGRVI